MGTFLPISIVTPEKLAPILICTHVSWPLGDLIELKIGIHIMCELSIDLWSDFWIFKPTKPT